MNSQNQLALPLRALLFAGTSVLAFGLTACGAPDGSGGFVEGFEEEAELGELEADIVNGTVPDQWGKGIVAVISSFSGVGTQRCSGTFITRYDVLTAAHCLVLDNGLRASKVEVVLGSNWNGTRYTPRRWVVHPDWVRVSSTDNDIGLISFSSPLAPSGTAMPVAEFAMPEGSFEGRQVVMAGFGISKTDGSGAGTKRWTYARIKDNSGDELLVDGEGSTATCDGDSGGPVTMWNGSKWVVVGVISGGSSASCTTTSLTYCSMPTHQVDFINDNLSIGVIVIP